MKLDKKSIVYRSLRSNLFFVFILLSSLTTSVPSIGAFLFLGFIAVGAIAVSLTWQYLYWEKYEYQITPDTFDITSGILRRDRREIPLHRIQNVDITQNFVLRILKIARVNIETAGGSSTEAKMEYVSYDEAKRIQRRVRQLKESENGELRDKEEQEQENVLYEINSKELTILSLTSMDNRVIAGVFFLLSFVGGLGGLFEAIGLSFWVASAIFGTGIILFSWLAGAALTFSRYYDFRLTESNNTLEYERGLLNRASGSIPYRKIQTIRLQENPLKRMLGYATLKIDTAGYSPQTTAQRGSEAAVPLARREKSLDLGRRIRSYRALDLNPIPRRAVRRYFFRYTVLATLIIWIGFAIDQWIYEFNYLILTSLIPLALIASYFKWKNKGFAEGENHFYTMNGFWNRNTTITPYYRLQTLTKSQTIFQRRLDLATVILDTAGSSLTGKNPKAVDIETEDADKVNKNIFQKFLSALNS